MPIILYNVSSRTGVNILPETCLKLSKIDNIVGIKEASGNISQVAKIASLCGDDLAIYSGNIDMIDALFCEVNPIPVKYALNQMGYDFGKPRLPLIELSDVNKKKVDKVLKKHL